MDLSERVQQASIEMVSDLKGKIVLLRVDVNTTLINGQVPEHDWRIEKALHTMRYLADRGARVIVISHIESGDNASLKPVYEYMRHHISLGFIPRYDDELIEHSIVKMQHGSIIMLENVRQHPGEKDNDSSYLDTVIAHADLYVNDAFSVSHRAHASVSDITRKLPSYFGLQICDEVEYLSQAVGDKAQAPRILVLGGAKFGTKLDLLRKFLPTVDYALIGGALANVFLRERGINIGASFAHSVDIADMVDNEKIILPIDAVDQEGDIIRIDQVRDQDMILDIGPETESLFEKIIDTAGTVLWNGPMGKYEDGFIAGTRAIAESIARTQGFSVTGGGDTAAVIVEEKVQDQFDFISTGGGAMLDFLVSGTLPGIEAVLATK